MELDVKLKIAIALTVMATGRAMTLAFIGRAGGSGVGDPPDAWLMPLVGDAVIGLSAVVVAYLLWKVRTPATWVVAVVWSAIAAFDALAALLVEISSPWPEFFMLQIFGRSMFLAATAMHLAIIYLLTRPDVRQEFGVQLAPNSASQDDRNLAKRWAA